MSLFFDSTAPSAAIAEAWSPETSPPLAAASARPSRARALWRFAALLGVLFSQALACFVAGLGRGEQPRLAARHVQLGSRRLLRRLGVVVRREGEPPRAGALIVANHRSYLDIAVIGAAVPCCFLAKVELRRWPLIGWAARQGGTIFVRRDDPPSRRRAREELRRRLVAHGVSAAVFPEGTTTAAGLGPFKKGAFAMAAEAGLTVVPVALEYDDPEAAWVGDATFLGHFLKIFAKPTLTATLRFGPPITVDDPERLRRFAQDWIAARVRRDPTASGPRLMEEIAP